MNKIPLVRQKFVLLTRIDDSAILHVDIACAEEQKESLFDEDLAPQTPRLLATFLQGVVTSSHLAQMVNVPLNVLFEYRHDDWQHLDDVSEHTSLACKIFFLSDKSVANRAQ